MDRWQAMRVFVKVAEGGGFAEAGRQLNLSPPAVTRVIAGLEEMIGAQLLVRTTRRVKLTEAGTRYLEDCRRILADIAEAEAAAGGAKATPTGTLVVTASVLFGNMYVLPLLTDYLNLYPAMTLRAVFLDRIANIIDEGIDLAVRIGHLADSSLSAVRVGTVRRVVVGSPGYFKKYGQPKTPADLARHNIVSVTNAWASLDWRFGRDEKTVVTVAPRLFSNTNEAAISAAIAGWGLARPLSYQVGPAVQDGSLKIVLADYEEEPLPIHLVHPGGRHVPAKVRSFIDFAAERLRANKLIN
ncbi:MAG TPA: LysR family transcriptional regulator [Terriglobales bacterium]|nr:LysR family transcriptional regulator [Terriglobales bacterium]